MTDTPGFLPKPRSLRRVLFVAFEDVGLLDLTGAQTVFWAATKALAVRGLPGYERHNASLAGGLVRSAEGLELQALMAFGDEPNLAHARRWRNCVPRASAR